MARWTRICRLKDIPCPGAHVVRRANAPNVAVFRTEDDRLFALLDRCPHRGAPLSQGVILGETVACPLHQTNVELESGNAVAPDKGCVQTFSVKVEKGVVYVDLQLDDLRSSATPSWGIDRMHRIR
jgi:nitrite reductase (NADH) small subunit